MKKKLAMIIVGILIIIGLITCIVISKLNQNNKNPATKEVIWSEEKNVNEPILAEGMKAITFEEGKETPIEITEEEKKQGIWYNYIEQEAETKNTGTSKWANAMTKDGSMWVWIPRYAYKIEWNQEQEAGKIDIMFLKGETNYNKNGEDVTKLGYKVHPAFQNGKNNNYNNGEWDKEITGIWVSKFEAGYAGQKNTASENIEVVNTNLQYQRNFRNIFRRNKRTRNIYDISSIYRKNIFVYQR